MSLSERPRFNAKNNESLHKQFADLRKSVHAAMKLEVVARLDKQPDPTEEELHMGVFKEWIEPQVRDAIIEMNRKGYATQSSGFNGQDFALQSIDGIFTVDGETKSKLENMGVSVLRGKDIGLPLNKLVTILKFRANEPSVSKIKERWDAVAALLPQKTFPTGIRPMSDRAEEFRMEYAPSHPSLDEARIKYYEYMTRASEADR